MYRRGRGGWGGGGEEGRLQTYQKSFEKVRFLGSKTNLGNGFVKALQFVSRNNNATNKQSITILVIDI